MISFSPKTRFQKNKDTTEAWAKVVHEPLIHIVLEQALAEMAFRYPSSEQLLGVNNFIGILLNLAEPPDKGSPLPPKELKSFDQPYGKPATPTQTK